MVKDPSKGIKSKAASTMGTVLYVLVRFFSFEGVNYMGRKALFKPELLVPSLTPSHILSPFQCLPSHQLSDLSVLIFI